MSIRKDNKLSLTLIPIFSLIQSQSKVYTSLGMTERRNEENSRSVFKSQIHENEFFMTDIDI